MKWKDVRDGESHIYVNDKYGYCIKILPADIFDENEEPNEANAYSFRLHKYVHIDYELDIYEPERDENGSIIFTMPDVITVRELIHRLNHFNMDLPVVDYSKVKFDRIYYDKMYDESVDKYTECVVLE